MPVQTIVYAIYQGRAINGELSGDNRQVCVKANSDAGRELREAAKEKTGLPLDLIPLPYTLASHGVKVLRIG